MGALKSFSIFLTVLFVSSNLFTTSEGIGLHLNLRFRGATLTNVHYGENPEQIMDVYLPGKMKRAANVIVLIHGGAWSAGSKDDVIIFLPFLLNAFPNHAVVNMNYRLGTIESPGYPKQIEDIKLALQFLVGKRKEYKTTDSFGLIGFSAGGHLALLYGYGFDNKEQIEGIANVVGPVDLTHSSYNKSDEAIKKMIFPLVGNYTYEQNPELYRKVSPIYYVTKNSPKTIGFYGKNDPLIPRVQGYLLKNKLDEMGVENELHMYEGGHGLWSPLAYVDFFDKVHHFFNENV